MSCLSETYWGVKMDDGWRDKYVVKSHGSVGECWAVFSTRWSSVRPMNRISPWFASKAEATAWIQDKWNDHVNRKFEQAFLSDNSDSETRSSKR